jgi:hypothetical protein
VDFSAEPLRGLVGLTFRTPPANFTRNGQRAVSSVREENLCNVEIVVDLFQATLDAIEIFARGQLLQMSSLPGKSDSFLDKHPSENHEQEDSQPQEDGEKGISIAHDWTLPFNGRNLETIRLRPSQT